MPHFFVEKQDGQSIAIVNLMNHWPVDPLRLEYNLDAAVFLVAECLVYARSVFQWDRMRDHKRWDRSGLPKFDAVNRLSIGSHGFGPFSL